MEGRVPGVSVYKGPALYCHVCPVEASPRQRVLFPSSCTKEGPSPGFKSALAEVACATFRYGFGIQLSHSLKWESECRLLQSSTKRPLPIPQAQNHLVFGLQVNLCWLQPQALCMSCCSVWLLLILLDSATVTPLRGPPPTPTHNPPPPPAFLPCFCLLSTPYSSCLK